MLLVDEKLFSRLTSFCSSDMLSKSESTIPAREGREGGEGTLFCFYHLGLGVTQSVSVHIPQVRTVRRGPLRRY